jgi:transaldolase
MIREGERIIWLHPQIVVKLPMTEEGVQRVFSQTRVKLT